MAQRLILLWLGGGLGTLARYFTVLGLTYRYGSQFPFGTLTVNLVGCFLIGMLAEYGRMISVSTEWRLFFITGLLGGFTTFSAFGLETYSLAGTGALGLSALYVLSSVLFGLCAVWCGTHVLKLFL